MSVWHGTVEDGPSTRVPRLDFELTSGCDHKCGHCYNVWTADEGDPNGTFAAARPMKRDALLALMDKAVTQSGAQHITLTGGEPLLHPHADAVIEHACATVKTVTLITNGSHITEERAAHFAKCGLRSVQLTLLAGDREQHDKLKGAVCFDDTCRSAVRLLAAGVPVQLCYVAMKENEGELPRVLELCAALGIRSMSYNRMSPTGRAIHHIARLLPSADSIEQDLDLLEHYGRKWGISVATAMPIPPCLVRIDRYSWVRFGFCSTGSSSPNIVIDGRGDVRSCNLSSNVLGNLVEQEWDEVFNNPYPRAFKAAVPEMCRGCAYETSCQGGCKESGFAAFGSLTHPEPLIWLNQDPARLESFVGSVSQHEAPTVRGSSSK